MRISDWSSDVCSSDLSYNVLFFLAGLQAIPLSLIEAAAIDGAGPLRRFWTIVFPLLSPTTFFLIVVNVVYAFFETFGIIHTITKGGPGKATEILVRSEEHTSELQSLMRISYAVFCLKKKTTHT